MKWITGTFLFCIAIMLIMTGIKYEEDAMRAQAQPAMTFERHLQLNPEMFDHAMKGDKLLEATQQNLQGGALTDAKRVNAILFLHEFGRRRLAELCAQHSDFVTDADCAAADGNK